MAGNLRIKHLAVEALVPYARNARTHSVAQVDQIAASIEEFGFTNPVLLPPEREMRTEPTRTLPWPSLNSTMIQVPQRCFTNTRPPSWHPFGSDFLRPTGNTRQPASATAITKSSCSPVPS